MREHVTTAFEVVGLVVLAVALGLYLARFDLALGLAAGGALLLAEALAVEAIARKVSAK